MADGDDDRRRALMASSLGCGVEPCPAALTASAAAVDAVTEARESLARFAATTPDPAAYALAYRMCGSGRLRDGACGMLSAEQWARLDPGNAVAEANEGFSLILSNVVGANLVDGTAAGTILDDEAARFHALTACRLADTRQPSGPSGGPALTGNRPRTFPVTPVCMR